MKDDFEKLLTVAYLILALISPIVGGSVKFTESQDISLSIKTGAIILVVVLVLGFFYEVAKKISERWAGRTAEGVDSWLQALISGFQKKYLKHLIYLHRDFDVKGLSTQGSFYLELERIFVELVVSPKPSHLVSTDIIHSDIPQEFSKGGHSVWDYLMMGKRNPKKLVILGAPGSGKTTLLKNIAITLAGERKHTNKIKVGQKIPILLFLREHAEIISNQPDIHLPKVIQTYLEKYEIRSPQGWFESRLHRGMCIVMLDGLDEVADPKIRRKVISWVEKQMAAYPRNHFIVTSRPFGYREAQLQGAAILEVVPFNLKQIKQFINNWYLANEIQSYQKDDEGVRIKAREGASDLFIRLGKTSNLMDLAVNPLLLTMISTVHRYRSTLPGRRVELYKEICEVFLGKHQGARGLELPLTPAQKQSVLQPLAYHMMCNNIREIDKNGALNVIGERLMSVSPQNTGEEFLQMIENSSGLLLERRSGIYGFAHKTFQEYLASVHILEQKLENKLVSHIEDEGWHECIRLYSAQANATIVIDACLEKNPPSAPALALAVACEDEAREVDPISRQRLETTLLEGVESQNIETRHIIAEALLGLNIRNMMRMDDNTYISRRFVNHAEYQLFLDQMTAQENFIYPDHWTGNQFPRGSGLQAAVGVRASDAIEFCSWLSERESGEWRFRLPARSEASLYKSESQPYFWLISENQNNPPVLNMEPNSFFLNPTIIDSTIQNDLKLAKYLEQTLALDIIRKLELAKTQLAQTLSEIKQASEYDLGVSGVVYGQTSWAKITEMFQKLSEIFRDVNTRASSHGLELESAILISRSMDLARLIYTSRDTLRRLYQPNAYAPDRAHQSSIAISKIQRNAQELDGFMKYFDNDVIRIQNFAQEQAHKLTGDLKLPIINIVKTTLNSDQQKLLPTLKIIKAEKPFEFMNFSANDYSNFLSINKSVELIANRNAAERRSDNWKDRQRLISWYLRMTIILTMERLISHQELPKFLAIANKNSLKKTEITNMLNSLKNLYINLVIQEARAQGYLQALEGIRLVKERTRIEV